VGALVLRSILFRLCSGRCAGFRGRYCLFEIVLVERRLGLVSGSPDEGLSLVTVPSHTLIDIHSPYSKAYARMKCSSHVTCVDSLVSTFDLSATYFLKSTVNSH
jgi:hypothetical protein